MVVLVPIVEGHGEVQAVPALLHRVFLHARVAAQLLVNYPIRIKSGSFLNDFEYFEKYVALAAAKAALANGHVLILLDCEDDCPATLGPQLAQRARTVRADVGVIVVLAYREYETWFLTAAASLRGRLGLPDDLNPPTDPVAIRNAKDWLGERMPARYDPILHQFPFTRIFSLDQARANDSFQHLYSRITELS